jgi:hypothetical protein
MKPIELTRNFIQGSNHYNAAQKELLLSKADVISLWISRSIKAEDTKEPKDFLKELEESLVLVSAPFEMPPIPSDSPLVQEVFQVLFDGSSQNPKAAFSHLFKTLTGPGKQAFLKKEKEALQGFLNSLYPKLKTVQTKEEHFWGAALIGQLLAYYTFFGPENGEIFSLPIESGGTWHLFDYKVEKIPLTPSWMGSQAVAFGLTSEKGSPPLLLFKGTSYPTDEGFCLQLLTDFNPLASVGSYLFWLGKKNIENWLTKAPGARVFGMSLGGSLTELAALHFPSLIKRAFAYNPPALFPWDTILWGGDFFHNSLERGKARSKRSGLMRRAWPKASSTEEDREGVAAAEQISKKITAPQYKKNKPFPEVHIFHNEKDLASASGFCYGKGWNVYEVLVKNPSSFLPAHVQCYLGRKESIIMLIKHPKKTFSQILFATLHAILSLPLFLLGGIVYAFALIFKRRQP